VVGELLAEDRQLPLYRSIRSGRAGDIAGIHLTLQSFDPFDFWHEIKRSRRGLENALSAD
jgi:hypothetical protein